MVAMPTSQRTRRGPGRPPKPQQHAGSALAQLGGLIRCLRGDRGLTLMSLGALTGYSWQHLGAVERGQVVPSEAVIVACERVLAAGGQLAAAFPVVVREQASRRHNREASRRDVSTGADWCRLAAAARRPSVVSSALVEDLEQISARQRVLYHELSSAEMLVSVEAHLGLLASLMRGTQPEPVRHRVASAAVEAAGFAAWLWLDLGDQFKMGMRYKMAAGLIEEAGNPALGSYITGYRALAAEASGSGCEAIRHAETAMSQAPAATSRLARSWLSAVRASTVALTGDHRVTLDMLGQARDHLDAAQDKEEWMYDFDHSALAEYQGQCHLRLGQAREAMAAFEAGLAELPPGCDRRRAFLAVGVAEACVHGQAPDAAVHHAYQALEVFAARGSTAGLLHVQRFRGLLAAAGYLREARELDQRIRDYLGNQT
jgi:hypothetical protein